MTIISPIALKKPPIRHISLSADPQSNSDSISVSKVSGIFIIENVFKMIIPTETLILSFFNYYRKCNYYRKVIIKFSTFVLIL